MAGHGHMGDGDGIGDSVYLSPVERAGLLAQALPMSSPLPVGYSVPVYDRIDRAQERSAARSRRAQGTPSLSQAKQRRPFLPSDPMPSIHDPCVS